MNFFNQRVLLFIVFITGACVLVLEVVAVRILSPFFGNTIYSYSSILSVILGALSFGYYFGGKYADNHPNYKNFFGIIVLSGFTVLLMEFLVVRIVPQFAYSLSFTSGPLIASCILFALPSFFLGTLSPYAIKLQETTSPKEGIGKLTGEIFFFSTMGSILGSLLTGFFLIPYFGIQSIVLGTGIVLLVIGSVGYLSYQGSKKKVYSTVGASILLFSFIQAVTFTKAEGVVHLEDGVYERLLVYDTELRGRPARMLMQDRSAASALDKETGKVVFEYSQYYQLYKLIDQPKDALFIGAGTYTMPKMLSEELPDASVDVVDIEPKLYDIAKKYFQIGNSSQIINHVGDGRRYLHDINKKYDYIFSDAYASIYSIPSHLTTREFFELVKTRLNDNGIFIVNIIGNIRSGERSLVLSELKTLEGVFPNVYLFATNDPRSKNNQNFILVAYNSDKDLDLKTTDVIDHVTGNPIDLLRQKVDIDAFDFSEHSVFTDNYAPLDLFSADLLKAQEDDNTLTFDGESAIQLIKEQVAFGPRYPGSDGHGKMVGWLDGQLSSIEGARLEKQMWTQKGVKESYNLTNFIFRVNPDNPKRVIVGTHFDTLKVSVDGGKPIPGANNGASGTAVMLEAARVLSQDSAKLNVGVDFVFFDAEEGDPDIRPGSIAGWMPWGSGEFVKHVSELYPKQKPDHMINLDLVCSKNAKFYYELNSMNSAPSQTKAFWDIGMSLASDIFQQKPKYSIIDDHVVLQRAGIPSFLVIDFDYPPIHSTTDTVDMCSSRTLGKMGDVLLKYLYSI